ncbi:hypothetical protein COCVIDRAFT_84456 [Bipolaris victoriae FI3]|uniref:Uncharacterized protein n=1 Tax=Bipolaris victoriae (strain FI3) TaxID=930091 RepID=W7EXH8_BIPV3|nr:hypothetical protein COCVIDRAFT_84456 [Bipolaris victoriae FI3]
MGFLWGRCPLPWPPSSLYFSFRNILWNRPVSPCPVIRPFEYVGQKFHAIVLFWIFFLSLFLGAQAEVRWRGEGETMSLHGVM